MAEKPLQSLTIQGLSGTYVNTPLSTAPVFNNTTAYAIGDYVFYNRKLYKFTSAHAAGAWDSSQAEEVTIGNEIKQIGQGLNSVDIQINDVSIMNNGVANIPLMSESNLGVAKIGPYSAYGISLREDGTLQTVSASSAQIKNSLEERRIISPSNQHESTFYGLAKAAGDITQSSSENEVGTYTNEAKAAIQTMLDVPSNSLYASDSTYGLARTNASLGISASGGVIRISNASSAQIIEGTNGYRPITPSRQHESVFYGLAKIAGDTSQASSSNAVGTYTDNAKAAIKAMLGVQDSTQTVVVSGTTPTITALTNTRYICGEVSTLTVTPPGAGICEVVFTSGSTPTVLTATGVTFPSWFDPTALEADTTYEISIADGKGVVCTWAS